MRSTFVLLLAMCLLSGCGESDVTPPEKPSQPETSSATPTLEVFATGANISGANGIHFGPDGLLYVTSVIGSSLTVHDPETGEEVRRFTEAQGVIGPDDVAFAPDGSYYWTSILTGEVAGFDPDGNKVIAAQLPPGPNPVTFSDDGRLFISQCFLGHNVYELDPKGVDEPRIITEDLGPGCGLNGMDWGPDDRLYGPRWFFGEVVSLDVESGEWRVEATGFTTPAAIKFDSKGVLHVLDTGTGQVLRVVDGNHEVVVQLEPGLDNFAFDENDTIFVSSFVDGDLQRVNADGSITSLQPAGMAHPAGVAVAGGKVWVADMHSIRSYDRNSGESVDVQRNIVGVGDLGGAINLAADGDHLILSSWFDNDVRIWDPDSKRRVAHYPDLGGPTAAVRYANGIAIAEHNKGTVTLYADEPIELASGFKAPTALVASGDRLYLGDRSSGEISLIAEAGRPLQTPVVVVSGLEAPEGFLVTDNGFVVVEAQASRVVQVSESGERSVLASFEGGSEGTPSGPPSQLFNGIAMDADENLFITGETSRVLYRIEASR